jgi:hypothetical protein
VSLAFSDLLQVPDEYDQPKAGGLRDRVSRELDLSNSSSSTHSTWAGPCKNPGMRAPAVGLRELVQDLGQQL